jgi:hypothetical protein
MIMDRIEEILKLSPLFAALSQEEKNELVEKLISCLSRSSDIISEESPLSLL